MVLFGKLSLFVPQAYRGILFIARKYENSFFLSPQPSRLSAQILHNRKVSLGKNNKQGDTKC